MARPEKEAAVAELKENIQKSTVAVMTQYKGITVAEVTDLRAKFREENVVFKVYKNTLARRALDDLELSEVGELIDGPTAWAFSEDAVAPARILKNFAKQVQVLVMRGGVLEGKLVDAETLGNLADLPTRDVLLAQFVGTLAMPLRNFVGTLSAVPRNFVNVLEQVRKQKEESESA